MKKYIITCIATLLGVYFAQADNINVQDVTMDAGQSGTISINLTNSTTNYVSFQMDLYLPDGFTLNKTGNTLSNRFSSGELVIGRQSDGAYRLTGNSFSLNPITGTSGELLTLSVKAPSSAAIGTANIRNILFATSQSTSTTMTDVSFSLFAKGEQSLSFSSIPTKTYGDAAYTLPSQTDQGLTLSWSVSNTSVATASGNTLTIKGAGTATVTATQVGSNIYYPFSKTYTLTVNKAPLTITAKSYTITYGSSLPTFAATYSGFKNNETSSVLTQQPTFSCSASSSSTPGTYDINVSGAAANNYTISYVKGTLTINAKNASNLTISSISSQTYTGSAITPTVTVKDGSKTLTNGTDYTVAYSNNTNAGTATVTITGKGNYTGTKTASFTINAKAASNLTISSIAAQTYTGSALTPAVTVKDGSTTLTSGTDYTVAYSNNTNAGTATVTITGKGNYTGTKTATFTINAKSASSLTISSIAAQTYTGSALTPTVTVKDGTTTLTSGTDYTVTYSDNTNVGTATVTVTGKGNYTGTKTATFTINAKNASDLTISSIATQTYTGSAITPEITVKDETTTLTVGKDYTVEYSDNTNVGTATITVTGKGNYLGIKTATFAIVAKDASSLTIGDIVAQTYTGSALTPAVTVKDGTTTLTSGTDYTVAYSDNTNVGTATVTVTGKGNYTGTKTATFTINAKAASNLTISSIAAQTYTGSALTPAVTVKDGSTTLTSGTDYTVAYSDNTNVGTATVTVTGKGNYTGTKTATFTINAKSASDLTISDIAAVTYNGTAQTPTITVKDGSTTLTSGTDYTVAYSDNTNVGTANVTVTGKGNYSGTKTATFTIEKAVLTITAKSYTITQGNPLPTFEATYSGFKNGETSSVLTTQPSFSCSANPSSAPGTYDIVVSDATANNYTITYVNGTLTIKDRSIIFADPVVEDLCVANWDTDGNGSLGYMEAAAVTDLGQVFKSNKNITSFDELQYFTGLTSIGNSAFYYCGGLTSVTIPNSVTAIGDRAFYKCSGLTSVTIGNSVTTISIEAFYGCSGLTSVTIPNSVTAIGNYAFYGCSGLTSVTIPNSVTTIGNYAFSGCSGLTSVTIPNSVTAISQYAFNYCSGLTSVTIGNSVTSIGDHAFNKCSSLTSVIIPNSVTTIGIEAFYGCSDLTSVTIGNSVTDIGNNAFGNCSGLTSVTIGNSVTAIGNNAFSGCSGLTSVTIPNSVTAIGNNAFGNCSGLTSVTIGNSVTAIGNSAFYGCSGLTSVTIPNSVTSIGSNAFKGCSGLTSVIIPNSVTSIASDAFNSCSGLTNISVESGNTVYDSRNNCNGIVKTTTNTLVLGCKNTTIPNSVTSIGDRAFYYCGGLTSVTIPNSVKSIGSSAFYHCSGLTSVTIPNSVTAIGTAAFSYCSGLTSVTIPNSVKSIGTNAFSGCTGLTSVIVERETPVSISSSTTFSTQSNVNLYVPKGAKTAYATADVWKDFKAIKEFPDGDVNEDGETDVVDVVDIARTVIEELTGDVIRHLADQDQSNSVTVADAVLLINDIAGDTNWAKPMMARRSAANDVLKLVSTDGNSLSLQMDSNGQYAAFQFDLWLPENVDIMEMALNNERRQGHQLLYNKVSEGHYRVVALSTVANIFKGSSGELLDMTLDGFATDNIQVDDIRFVTPEGSERLFDALGVTRNGIATSIEGMNGDDNCDKRTVYNLNGQRMNTPQRGLNIINGRKVVIK